ncbi:large ribosomal subunit protein mL53 [Lampetra fluviatilis]
MAARGATSLSLKAVKSISVRLCPFQDNVRSTREFLMLIGSDKVRDSNDKCNITTEVRNDNSEPQVDITFNDGDKLVMRGAFLTSKEMFQAFKENSIQKDSKDPTSTSGAKR